MRPRYFVAGHRGMVGSAIVRKLVARGDEVVTRSREDLDLTDGPSVHAFFRDVRPEIVVVAAARVGGIYANDTYPAEFIYQNLMIECNLIHEAFMAGVNKLLFLGSSCIYPRDAAQPMPEETLMTGIPELTNEPYAVAKIAGIKLCESYNRQYGVDYRSVIPTNLYGPGDNFQLNTSHVVPALLRRFHNAIVKETGDVTIWGSGRPLREFLHVDDMAEACLFVLDMDPKIHAVATTPRRSHLNIGSGEEVSIQELASIIAEVSGFSGQVRFDHAMPDGSPRKLIDSSRLRKLGWRPSVHLKDGLTSTYRWMIENTESIRS